MSKKIKVDQHNYFVEFYWMSDKLGLKGNELRLYALIYSYSQDNRGGFYGTTAYMAKRLKISRRQIFRLIDELTKKDLIIKKEYSIGEVRYSAFEVNFEQIYEEKSFKQTYDKMSQVLPEMSQVTYDKMSHPSNNKDLNNKEDKIDKSSVFATKAFFTPNINLDGTHILTRYLINHNYITKEDELEIYKYNNYFNKEIGKNGYEYEDFKLYVQYFVHRYSERTKDKKPIKRKFPYFVSSMNKAKYEFSQNKEEKLKELRRFFRGI